jgi:fermentation-respiration switch protein FrsA (DUF1100 family)
MELPPPRPADQTDEHRGLAYALWLPDAPVGLEAPAPGMLILHGAGSRKENHADFARLCASRGWAALSFDARGHGETAGELSGDAVEDAVEMARYLAAVDGVDRGRIAVRGSSLGGFLAIHAAASAPEIAGVIAICPAGEDDLARGLRSGRLEMAVSDPVALEAWLLAHDLGDAVERLGSRPLILLHAEGDDQIPVDRSRKLYERKAEPRKLIVAPGGHHRSVQHDPELQGLALRWLERELARSRTRRA